MKRSLILILVVFTPVLFDIILNAQNNDKIWFDGFSRSYFARDAVDRTLTDDTLSASNISNGGAIRTYFLSFFAISLWQALAQSHFWGVYIAPEHDTVLTNKQKVWRAHVPHLCTSLLFLIIFNSKIMFIALQMFALILTSIGLRMPVWWDTTAQQPPSTRKGLFGLPRTAGARTIE